MHILKVNSAHLKRNVRNAMANSKDVVVTGVSTGIGWGTTKVLVSKGFRVFDKGACFKGISRVRFCTQAG